MARASSGEVVAQTGLGGVAQTWVSHQWPYMWPDRGGDVAKKVLGSQKCYTLCIFYFSA